MNDAFIPLVCAVTDRKDRLFIPDRNRFPQYRHKRRQVGGHGLPKNVQVSHVITVHKLVAHSNDILPGNSAASCPPLGGDAVCNLTQNSEQVKQRVAHKRIALKRFPALSLRYAKGLLGMIQHVAEVDSVVMQRHTHSPLRQEPVHGSRDSGRRMCSDPRFCPTVRTVHFPVRQMR